MKNIFALLAIWLSTLLCARASLQFNGSNSYVAFDNPFLNGASASAFSFDFWIKVPDPNRYQALWGKTESGGNTWLFQVYPGSFISFYTAKPGYSADISSPPGVVKTNEWQHVTVVGSGSSFQMFVDAALVKSVSDFGSPLTFRAAIVGSQVAPMSWGFRDNFYSGDDGWFGGALADFQVWDRTLSASEILAFHNAPASDSASGLRHRFPLNSTSGQCVDVVGGVTGRTSNTTWSTDNPSFPSTGLGKTIRVPADQPTIQAAVAIANSGDTILLADGVHLAHGISLAKPVTIRSVNGSAATVVDGENLGGIFQVNTSDAEQVNISGLTIKHGDMRKGWATIRRLSGRVEVRDCVFEENYSNGGVIDARGGADYSVLDQSKTYVADCVFRNNSAENYSGVLGVTVVRSVFYNNTGWNSPVVMGSCIATNCTLYNNTGGVLFNPWTTGGAAASTLVNCILWGNSGYNGQQIDGTSTSNVKYSLLQGGYPGVGNLSTDPQFSSAATGDFHLQAGSPAINAGDPTISDADGSRSDMGAHGGYFPSQLTPVIPFSDGLVAYYPFDGNANDASGLGRHATNTTPLTYLPDRFGRANLSCGFDGLSSIAILPAKALGLAGTSKASFSLWVKPAVNQAQTLFVYSTSAYYTPPPNPIGVLCELQTDGRIGVFTASDSDRNWSRSALSSGNWYQVTVVYNGLASTPAEKVAIYINGVAEIVDQVRPEVIPTAIPAGADWCSLGGRTRGNGSNISFLRGSIDDVRIYSRDLSKAEIKALHDYESTPPDNGFITNGLVAYYPFNGTASDESGNGNNLALNAEVHLATDRLGASNGAIQFGNSTTTIRSFKNVGIVGNASRTMSFWVKHAGITPWPQSAAVQWGNGSANGALSTLGANNIRVQAPFTYESGHVFFGGFNADCVSGAQSNVGLNEWHHYAFTYGGNLTTSSLYVDGVSVAYTHSGVATLNTADTTLLVGGGSTNGCMDDIRIYNRTLSAAEIKALYNYESTPPEHGFITNGLAAYYPFDGDANDKSGGGHHGVLHGSGLTPASDRLGVTGGALHFTSDAYISIAPIPFNANSDYSILFWVRGDSVTGSAAQNLLSLGPDDLATLNIRYVNFQSIQLQFMSGHVPVQAVGPSQVPFESVWSQYGFVKRGSEVRITVNGGLVYSGPVSGTVLDQDGLWIGRMVFANTAIPVYSLKASMDELRIYSRALNDQEVVTLYDLERTPQVVAPVISIQPSSRSVVEGQATILSVVAFGTDPLSYQWFKDGAAISGGTQSDLTLSNVQLSAAGSYTVQITNGGGTTTSTPAILTVIVPPRIITQPVAQSIIQGQPVSFSGTASGTAPLIYQWLKGGSIIAGASLPDLRIASVSPVDAGSYQLRVSNAAGTVTSAEAVLTVIVPPTIATAPTSQKVIAGQTARLTVTASGSAPLTYQWIKNGAAIAGATSAELAIANAQPANAGTYQVQISNAAGSVSSGSVTLTVIVPPTITTAPATQVVIAGQTARFTVAAAGSSPLTYEWFKDGVRVPGASLSDLVLANVQPANAGSYTVHVTNEGGTVNSSPAVLTVLVPPTITTAPVSQTVIAGQTAKLTVVANGSDPLSYQWMKDGFAIAGATQSDLIIANAQEANAGGYQVMISNAAGSIRSLVANLKVAYPPSIISQPEEATVFQGQPVAFSVAVAGTQPISLQWLKNGSPIAGATSTTLTIASALFTDAGNYSVDATSPYGSVRSLSARLSVKVRPNETLFDLTPGGGIVLRNPFQTTFPPDSFVTLTAQPANGWEFLDWKGSTQGTNPVARVQMTYSREVRARFGTDILPTPAGNGTISVSPQSPLYPYGSTVQLVAEPGVGAYFIGWSGSVESLENPLNLVVKDAHPVLVAAFDQLPAGSASFIARADGFGRIVEVPRNNVFDLGQSVTNTAIADDGQEFLGWTGDAAGTQNPVVVTLDKSKSITGVFTKRPRLELQSLEVEGFLLSLTGEFTGSFPLLRSTDVQVWESLVTLTNAYGESQLIIPPGAVDHSFYRIGTPPVPKKQATAICTVVNGFVVAVVITDPGSGYTVAPAVEIVGSGTGATAIGTILNGMVDKITVRSAGVDYSTAPEVRIGAP